MTYAKIDTTQNPSMVVNIQVINTGDVMDPAFTWVDITLSDAPPSVGCTYDPTAGFSTYPVVFGPVDTTQSYLHTGTLTTFTSFTLTDSNTPYTVQMNGNDIVVGCQTYSALWLRYGLYQLLQLNQPTPGLLCFNATGTKVQQGSFYVSIASATAILNALETINFFP